MLDSNHSALARTNERMVSKKKKNILFAFRPVADAAKSFDFKSCCTPKGDKVRDLIKNHFKSYSWLVYSRAHRDLYCKFRAIFASDQNTLTTTNNREKPGKLVTGQLWGFIRLTDKDGYFYEHDKLGYHKASIIKVRRDI